MIPTVIISFKTSRDEETGERHLEAKALDPDTHMPVVSMSLPMLAAWLRKHRYRWVIGSSGVWSKAA